MKLSGPNPMAQCTLLLTPNHAFPVHPIANAESGLPQCTLLLTPNRAFPVQRTVNVESILPNATYC